MVRDAIEIFLAMKTPNTKRTYFSVWFDFERLTGKAIEKITDMDAMRYFAELKARPGPDGTSIAAATIKHRYHVLNSIYAYLLDLGLIERNPIRAVARALSFRQATQKRPTALIPFGQVKKILRAPEARTKQGIRDRAILALLFGGGLRRSEVIGLNVEDIKVSPKGVLFVELTRSKAGVRQVRALARFSWRYVSRLVAQRKAEGAKEGEPLIPFYRVDGSARGRIDARTLSRRFKRYCALFGIKAAPHAARATFATALKSMGFDDREAAQALGHGTESMVRVYDKRARSVDDSPAIKLHYD